MNGATLISVATGSLTSVVFDQNTVSASKGHIAFRGRKVDTSGFYLDTVAITKNTLSSYAADA